MKRFYVQTVIATVAGLLLSVSCHPLPDIDRNVCTVSRISKIDIFNHETGASTIVNFEYVQYDKDNNMSELDTAEVNPFAPTLRRQVIEGDTLRSLEYSYPEDRIMDVEVESLRGKRTLRFKLNSKKMADSLYNGSGYDFYSRVQCDGNSMRSQVGDSVMVSKDGNYLSATLDGKECIRFEYPDSVAVAAGERLHNIIGIQQEDMPGEPYMWVSGAFGKQSKHFYVKKIVVRDDGRTEEFMHNYVVDDLQLLVEDRILRNGTPYKTVKYSYVEFSYRK